MYSLRIINTRTGAERNIALGNSYQLLRYEAYNAHESDFNNLVAKMINAPCGTNDTPVLTKSELEDYMAKTKHYATITADGVHFDLINDGESAYYIMYMGNTYTNLTKK